MVYADVARLLIRHDDETIDHRVMLAQLRQAGVSLVVFELVQGSLCLPDRRSTGRRLYAVLATLPLTVHPDQRDIGKTVRRSPR